VSAERTAQIIEAAVATFVRLGLADARMEDIAAEAGLSKATLYLYFDSKDALIAAILDSFVGRELAEARKLLASDRPALEKLERIIEIVVADTQAFLPYVPLYFDFLGMAMREQAVRAVLQEPFEAYMEIVVAIIKQGQASGEFRQVDATAAALALGTLIDGTLLLWAYDPELVDAGKQIRASVGLLLDGLTG
jgi:TetR/AcrR family fatty acid metabolism transcriptional regulator